MSSEESKSSEEPGEMSLAAGDDYDERRKLDSFNAYIGSSDEHLMFNQWCEGGSFHEYASTLPPGEDEVLTCLTVGPGPGEPDISMIGKLLKKYKKIEYTVVEPGCAVLSRFKENVAANPNLADVTFNFLNQSSQHFLDNLSSTDKKYDFIVIIQSMYYLGNTLKAVEKYHKLLENEGVMIIGVITDTGGWMTLWDNLYKSKFKIFKKLLDNTISSGTVSKVLDKLNCTYLKITIESHITFADVFAKNLNGFLILDFVSNVLNTEKEFVGKDLEKLLVFLREKCCREDFGEMNFINDVDYFIVRKC